MSKISRHRHSLRLPDYDYTAPGAYFITLCTWKKHCLFSEIIKGEINLSVFGNVAVEEWVKTSDIRKEISTDIFVVMPNHIHGIVIINNSGDISNSGATGRSPLQATHSQIANRLAPKSLEAFVAGYKSSVTKRINKVRSSPKQPFWQRNYYEHVIRNDHELQRVRDYIVTNPLRWEIDSENPASCGNQEAVGATGRSPITADYSGYTEN